MVYGGELILKIIRALHKYTIVFHTKSLQLKTEPKPTASLTSAAWHTHTHTHTHTLTHTHTASTIAACTVHCIIWRLSQTAQFNLLCVRTHYSVMQRILTVENYKGKKSYEMCQKSRTRFSGISVPSKPAIHKMLYTFRTTGLFLNKKQQQTRRVLSDETLWYLRSIRSISKKILKTVITGYQCIEVICTRSHKIMSLETTQI